jgi:DNA polymerase III gamma/tau subunit
VNEPLITKYRPKEWPQVFGHKTAIASLQDALMSDSCPHAFLFTGQAGLGKTSMARLLGDTLDATVIEINVAANNGIEAAKELVEMASYSPIYTAKVVLWILDECHTFTKQAWQTLLKVLEEPPPFLYIALCTTEGGKVPVAIQQRTFPIKLSPLNINDILDIIDLVCANEGWNTSDEVKAGIMQAADGLPRRALTLLQAGHGCPDLISLSEVITNVDVESSPGVELAKYLVAGGRDWGRIKAVLEEITDEEEAFAQMTRYLTTCIAKADKDGVAKNNWVVLDALTYPRTTWDKKAHLMAAVGALLWA